MRKGQCLEEDHHFVVLAQMPSFPILVLTLRAPSQWRRKDVICCNQQLDLQNAHHAHLDPTLALTLGACSLVVQKGQPVLGEGRGQGGAPDAQRGGQVSPQRGRPQRPQARGRGLLAFP